MAVLRRPVEAVLGDGRRVVVRSAQPRDAAAVAALLDAVASEPAPTLLMLPGDASARVWRRRIRSAGADPRALQLVALAGKEMAGQLAVRPEPHRASTHVCAVGIAVAAAWRSAGLGRVLLETALSWAAAAGFTKAALSVFAVNERAIAFYEANGFAREGLRRAHLRRGAEYHDEVLMARFLTPPDVP